MEYGYGPTFDRAGSWNFGNDYVGNFVAFGIDNSSSSHTDNHKNNFLVLGEGQRKGLVLTLVKQRQHFA